MKLVKKIAYYFLSTSVIILLSALIATVIYKGEIIDLLKIEVNKKIKTELEVDQIELKLIKGFPNISIDFQKVKFHSAFKDELFLEATHVYFVLNIVDLFTENIVVERLEIIDAVINFSVNQLGEKSFDVFVTTDSSEISVRALSLKSVLFKNVEINDVDAKNKINNGFFISSLIGGLEIANNNLKLDVNSSFKLVRTQQRQSRWLVNKNIRLNTKSEVVEDVVSIYASTISIEKVKLNLKGTMGLETDRKLDVIMSTSNLKWIDLRSILPAKMQRKLVAYHGSGNINLSTKIKGQIKGEKWPSLNAQIELNEFEFKHDSLPSYIKNISLSSTINISDLNNLKTGSLSVQKLIASIDGDKIEASGRWSDFISPQISGSVNGAISTTWLLSLINPLQVDIDKAKGKLVMDISGEVKINNSFELTSSEVDGSVNFDNVSIDTFFGLPIKGLQGELVFNNGDIKVDNLKGNYGKSNLLLNGTLSLPKEDKNRFYTNMEVSSTFVDLNEIVTLLTSSIDSTASISYKNIKYSANLNLKVDRLTLLKFNGKSVEVNLSMDENIINVNQAFAKGMGGEIKLNGLMTEQFNGDHYVKVNVQTKQINIDSLFYVFGNFKQTFITSEAIKGKLDANVNAYMYFTSDWSFRREMLYSEAILHVSEGKLINYEPVMSLSEYLHEEGENLSKLSFSDLENRIIVANDTIFISEMNVGTNVRNIKIGGYHTLNQHIDYRLSVPVIGSGRDSDEQFGKVKTDNSGQLYFPFRVYGTTKDYKVVYDLKTASKNFIKGVKKGIKDIVHKPAIKNSDDSLKLEEEEYFDWDNN